MPTKNLQLRSVLASTVAHRLRDSHLARHVTQSELHHRGGGIAKLAVEIPTKHATFWGLLHGAGR